MLHRPTRGLVGFTSVEIIVTTLILGIILIPLVRFLGVMMKGMVQLEARHQGQDVTRYAMVDIERDFKDMNEVYYGDTTIIRFYMDSHRWPWYNPNGDFDMDGIANVIDPDDDGDGLAPNAPLADMFNLSNAAPAGMPFFMKVQIATTGWRNGSDLDDDDDDNDGNRDVRCEYRYDPATKTLQRRFGYNQPTGVPGAGWEPPQVVAKNVESFQLEYFGALNAPGVTPAMDLNNDGIIDQTELDALDADGITGGPLNTFAETRFISYLRYTLVIRPNPKRPDLIETTSEIMPLLMPIKVKYP